MKTFKPQPLSIWQKREALDEVAQPGCREQDDTISDARAAFDWEKQFASALDPEWAKTLRKQALDESSAPNQHGSEYCTMCGPDFCSVRLSARLKKETSQK